MKLCMLWIFTVSTLFFMPLSIDGMYREFAVNCKRSTETQEQRLERLKLLKDTLTKQYKNIAKTDQVNGKHLEIVTLSLEILNKQIETLVSNIKPLKAKL